VADSLTARSSRPPRRRPLAGARHRSSFISDSAHAAAVDAPFRSPGSRIRYDRQAARTRRAAERADRGVGRRRNATSNAAPRPKSSAGPTRSPTASAPRSASTNSNTGSSRWRSASTAPRRGGIGRVSARQRSSRSTTGRCTRAFPRRRERRPRRASHRLRSGRRRGTVERRGWFGDRTRLVRRAAPAVVIADDTGAVSAALTPDRAGTVRPVERPVPTRRVVVPPDRTIRLRARPVGHLRARCLRGATSGSRSRGSPPT